MDYFRQAVEFVLKNEGGYVNNPADPGGATNFGISLRFLREVLPEHLKRYGIFEPLTDQTILELTRDQAILIYRGEFWDVAPFEKLSHERIINYVFDMAVHHGVVQAIKLFQRALWAVGLNMRLVVDDGILGDKTLDEWDTVDAFEMLIALVAERAGFMRLLCHERGKDKEFLNGWLARCYRT